MLHVLRSSKSSQRLCIVISRTIVLGRFCPNCGQKRPISTRGTRTALVLKEKKKKKRRLMIRVIFLERDRTAVVAIVVRRPDKCEKAMSGRK